MNHIKNDIITQFECCNANQQKKLINKTIKTGKNTFNKKSVTIF